MHKVHAEKFSRKEKRKIWDEIIADYMMSESSLQEYCVKHELKYDLLAYHVGEFKRKKRQQEAQSIFLPVQVERASASSSYRIICRDMELVIPVNFKLEEVTILIKALRSAIC